LPAGKVENGIISGLELVSDFPCGGRKPEHRRRAEEGAKQIGDTTYKMLSGWL